jgi:hypothetical protein
MRSRGMPLRSHTMSSQVSRRTCARPSRTLRAQARSSRSRARPGMASAPPRKRSARRVSSGRRAPGPRDRSCWARIAGGGGGDGGPQGVALERRELEHVEGRGEAGQPGLEPGAALGRDDREDGRLSGGPDLDERGEARSAGRRCRAGRGRRGSPRRGAGDVCRARRAGCPRRGRSAALEQEHRLRRPPARGGRRAACGRCRAGRPAAAGAALRRRRASARRARVASRACSGASSRASRSGRAGGSGAARGGRSGGRLGVGVGGGGLVGFAVAVLGDRSWGAAVAVLGDRSCGRDGCCPRGQVRGRRGCRRRDIASGRGRRGLASGTGAWGRRGQLAHSGTGRTQDRRVRRGGGPGVVGQGEDAGRGAELALAGAARLRGVVSWAAGSRPRGAGR